MVPALLRDRVFRRYWSASTVSMFGDQISGLALPLAAVLGHRGGAVHRTLTPGPRVADRGGHDQLLQPHVRRALPALRGARAAHQGRRGAGLLGIEKAALTGLADRAERRGLIARTAVLADRRALSVALTPAGRDAANAFHRDVSASLSQLTEVLPPGERARFCRSLARVAASASWP